MTAAVVCAGCGQPLTPRPGRGRRTQYHDATCRQRARRARLAAAHAPAWEALARLEAAAAATRRAMTTGAEAQAAIGDLQAAAAELAACYGSPPSTPGTITHVTEKVTGTSGSNGETRQHHTAPAVTENVTPLRQRTTRRATRGDAAGPTLPGPATATERPSLELDDPLDTSTVRMERGQGPGTWVVICGQEGNERVVGYLMHDLRRPRAWAARGAGYEPILGGPWNTRETALVQLIAAHQRKSKNTRRRRRP